MTLRAVLLLDADNVPIQEVPLSTILTHWLAPVAGRLIGVGDAIVRIYGGWWKDETMSEARHAAALFYAETCPALIAVSSTYWRVRFEFADSIVSSDGTNQRDLPIRHTFALRPAPPLVAAQVPGHGCEDVDCEVRRLRKWMYRRRGCTRPGCERRFADVWLRAEQKQVDTHLAVDLVLLAQAKTHDYIGLATDDIDLLPAIAVAFQQCRGVMTVTHLRFRTIATYLDARLVEMGGVLTRLPPPSE